MLNLLHACFFLLCLYLISNTRIYISISILYICSMYNSYKCLCSMSGVSLFVCLLCWLDLNIQNITLSQFSFIYLSISLIAMSNLHFVFDFYISLHTFEMYTYMLQLLEFVCQNNLHKNSVKHALFSFGI